MPCFVHLQGGLHWAVHLQRLQGPGGVPHAVAAAHTAALQALQADVDLPHCTQLLVGGSACVSLVTATDIWERMALTHGCRATDRSMVAI